jgi:hypothetical protein
MKHVHMSCILYLGTGLDVTVGWKHSLTLFVLDVGEVWFL